MLFVGDDWAEDHHDIEVQDEQGRVLARARLPEGIAGITRLHALIGQFAGPDTEPGEVAVGIETDRGLWVMALRAAGYTVYAINPRQVARYRERHVTSGAKSDKADAHTMADMVRTDSHQLRPVAGDSAEAQAIKVAARVHQTLIWERTRQVQRLRHQLREYFPAALEAFEDLDAPDALELLAKAPGPARAARLTRAQVAAALKRARRRDIAGKTDAILAALRVEQLDQPQPVAAVYAATVSSLTVIIAALNGEIAKMEQQVTACFRRHPDAAIYLSQPGIGEILGARELGEFGDDPHRYASAKARKNYAATSPITRQSGKKKIVLARFIRNDRLADALHRQAQSALRASPGARAYYDEQRDRGLDHDAVLRALSNRLVGILHGCLKTGTLYDEATAWSHRAKFRVPLDNQSPGVPLRTLRPGTKGQAGACPDRTRAIPCTVRAVNGVPTVVRTAASVPVACPIGRSTPGNHGHSRTARYTGSPADMQADPLRQPTF